MSISDVIPGLKLIRHNAVGVNIPDDPSIPYRLDVNLRPPDFMNVAFVFMHGGSEEIIVRGETREVLDEFIKLNGFETHSRLRSMTITGPNGIEYRYPDNQ